MLMTLMNFRTARFLHLAMMAGALFHVASASAQRSDDLAPNPEDERKSFKVADGWEANLFAAEPMVRKPIEMNFDPRGRLWVATSETYPQIKPGDVANDKIIILEDTTGAGKADKSTVFADKLLIPESVAPGDGGAYVTNSTEVLFLHENPKTHTADERHVVLDGFGTEDTHHIIHTLRWGPDGRLYFNQSIYIHAHVATPWGVKHLLAGGVWRFHPSTMQLEVYSRGLVNPWGDAWDYWGNSFQTDGAGGDGICYTFPGASYVSAYGVEKVLTGLNPGSPKYCSAEVLSGRHIPDDYQGDILTNDFRANRIVRYKLSDNGAGFISKQMPDFITSSDRAFRPVDIKMGPDGAIYIADLYNPIINHGEVDFRDPRRDHVHGRIWRLTAKGRPLVQRPALAGASVADLLEQLKAPEGYTRAQARQVLREKGGAVVKPALDAWVKTFKAKDPQTDHNLLEALWTSQAADVIDPALLQRVLSSANAAARAAAVRVAGVWSEHLPDAATILASAVDDENPRVRLEGVRALARIDRPESVTVATRVLDKPMDPFLDYALWLTTTELKDTWLPAFQSGKLTSWSKPAHVAYALGAVKSPAAVGALVAQLKAGQLPAEARNNVIDLIASIDPAGQAGTLLDLAVGNDIQDVPTRVHLLDALARMSREKKVRPGNDPLRISALLDSKDEAIQAAALRLAGAWQLQQMRPAMSNLAEAPASSDTVRTAAMQGLASLGGEPSVTLLRKLSEPPSKVSVRREAIGALATLDLKDAASRAATLLTTPPGDTEPRDLVSAFVNREGGSEALAAALEGKTIPTDTARLMLRYLQSLASTDSPLNDLVGKSIGVSSGPTKLTAEQMQQTLAEVMSKGDAARGERVFRRSDTGCYQCHSIGGSGGWLAPDLRAIGASSPPDYLVDSVLDPNKAVKDGYAGFIVSTKSGDTFSGIKVREDAQTLVLRDNANWEIPIAVSSIHQQKQVGSLMPTGLANVLTRGEFLDLIRFLSELGKPGPFALSTRNLVRTWRVLDPAVMPESVDASSVEKALAGAQPGQWLPQYSLVNGELPIDAIAPSRPVGIVRARLSSSAGKARLLFNSAKGLTLWIDGHPTPVADETTVDLGAGDHQLQLRVDPAARRGQGLRLEVADVAPSPAHAMPIAGK